MKPYTKRGLEKREGDDHDDDDDILSEPEDAETRFQLVGVINHSGSHKGGHYTSFIKERFPPNKPDSENLQWWQFNDSRIDKFDKSEMPDWCFGGLKFGDGTFANSSRAVKEDDRKVILLICCFMKE